MEKEKFIKIVTGFDRLNKETVEDLKALVEEHPSFQVGWMLYLKNLKQVNSSDFDSVLKKVAVQVSNRKSLYKFLNSEIKILPVNIDLEKQVSPHYNLGDEINNKPGDSLIDKFLSTNTGVILTSRDKNESLSDEYVKQVLEKSIDENDEIVTETLAVIYFQQKNYKKAQEAYKKLSLKYPEKSVYFATRIKEIEELKNI